MIVIPVQTSIFHCSNTVSRAPKPIVIVGPTASGKSNLAQTVAELTQGEVLSADSMQIYRGMDIGTGKVLTHEMRVPHHGLDLVDPGQPYSAALFQEYGRSILDNAARQSTRIIVCGGTGFYIRALLDDFDFPSGEQVDNPVRDAYNQKLKEFGPKAIWDELNRVDPESAAVIHENDSKRVVRAFELLADGTSYSKQKEAFAHIPPLYPAVYFGLRVDPAVLNERIDKRVDSMVEQGLVDEVRSLLQKGFRNGLTAPQAIGYKEIVAYLDGDCSLEEAILQIKIATHRYAKRQRTWFRKDSRIHWLDANEYDETLLASQIMRHLADEEEWERGSSRL